MSKNSHDISSIVGAFAEFLVHSHIRIVPSNDSPSSQQSVLHSFPSTSPKPSQVSNNISNTNSPTGPKPGSTSSVVPTLNIGGFDDEALARLVRLNPDQRIAVGLTPYNKHQ